MVIYFTINLKHKKERRKGKYLVLKKIHNKIIKEEAVSNRIPLP